MSIYIGPDEVSAVYVGDTLASAVYVGDVKIWPTGAPPVESWDFVDDFERTTIGSAWTGSGAIIAGTAPNRHLKKNSTAGSSDYWTTEQFASDDLEAEGLIGPIADLNQPAAIIFGSTSRYVAVEFSLAGTKAIHYDGQGWPLLRDFGVIGWAEGDLIRLKRSGSTFTLYRNGSSLGTFTSSEGIGSAYRRVGLNVRMARNIITWYGPTWDRISIRAN